MNFLDAALQYAERGWSILPIGPEKKPAVRRWKRYQSQPPSQPTLRCWFKRPNLNGLAVICGPVSGGLVVRDFDDEAAYECWAGEHPELAAKLPTVRTARGQHLFFTVPGLHKILTVKVNSITTGELRAAGYVLLPPSKHPVGQIYTWVNPLPEGPLPRLDPVDAGLMPDSLAPQLMALDSSKPMQQREQRQLRTTETTDDMVALGGGASAKQKIPIHDELLELTQPHGPGDRNRAIFDLARALKALPALCDADPRELRPNVVQWHKMALPVIATKPFEETWIDFLQAWPKVKYPLGTGPMEETFKRAKSATPPPEATRYDQTKVKLLASLCRELQRDAGKGPFFLSCRTAGRLLEVDHTTAWRWLMVLFVQDGLLEVTERGRPGGRRATRFRYIHKS